MLQRAVDQELVILLFFREIFGKGWEDDDEEVVSKNNLKKETPR